MLQEDINKARRLIRRGNFRLKAKEYDDAVTAYEKVLEYFPESREILITIGKVRMTQDKYDEAIRYLREAMNDKDPADIIGLISYCLTKMNENERALELVENIENHTPESEILLGTLLIWTEKNIVKGIEILKKYAHRDPTLVAIMGIGEHKLGNHANAIRRFRAVPDQWQALHGLGIQQISVQSLSTANSTIRQAKELYLRQTPISSQDDEVLKKFNFDSIATLDNRILRLDRLEKYKEQYGLDLTEYLVYLYTEFELERFSDKFDAIISEIETNCTLDENLAELFATWKATLGDDNS